MIDFLDGIEREGTIVDESTEIADLVDTAEDAAESSPETTEADATAEKTEPETASESSTEEVKVDEKPKEVPFHEDPKIQEYIQRQVDKRLEEGTSKLEESLTTKFAPKAQTTVPDWFGGDELAWQKYQAHEDARIKEAEDRAIQRIKSEQESEAKRITEANQWLDTNVSELEAAGTKVDRNKLMKTALDYQLIDTQGRWNYKAAAAILSAKEPKVDTTDKKKLAASTTETVKTEEKPRDYLTPAELRNKGWHDFKN
jgi:hypothetical protein